MHLQPDYTDKSILHVKHAGGALRLHRPLWLPKIMGRHVERSNV